MWLPAAGAGEPLFQLCDSVSQATKHIRGKHLLWIAETCLMRLARLVQASSYWDGETPRWPDGAREKGLYAFLRRMSSLVRRHSGLIQTRRLADFRIWHSIAKPLYQGMARQGGNQGSAHRRTPSWQTQNTASRSHAGITCHRHAGQPELRLTDLRPPRSRQCKYGSRHLPSATTKAARDILPQ